MKKSNSIKNSQIESTVDRIRNQGMKLFLERGYHGTSIDEIAGAAGLTKGAVYWHFESKEDLLRKILVEFEKRFLDGLIRSVEDVKGGAIDKFEEYIRYNSAFAYYNRELCVSFTTLAAELVGAHHKIEPEIRRIYKKYQKFLVRLILRGKREKVFKKELDPNLLALSLIGFHDGILFQWSMNRSEIDGKSYVNTFKNIMLNGLIA